MQQSEKKQVIKFAIQIASSLLPLRLEHIIGATIAANTVILILDAAVLYFDFEEDDHEQTNRHRR